MSHTQNAAGAQTPVTGTGSGHISLAIFLTSAVILFGVILTAYGIERFNDPGAFSWAPHLQDRRLGLAGAAALLVACITAAGAARLALSGRMGPARLLLGLALVGGGATLAVRVLEYPTTSRRAGFLPQAVETAVKGASRRASSKSASVLAAADAVHGRAVFLKTCAACHAPDGGGVKGQGANLRESAFIKDRSDEQLLAFVKVGRQPFDPETKLHLAMPARGGNPALTDQDLFDTIANLRKIQVRAAAAAPSKADTTKPASVASAAARTQGASSDQPQVVDGELWLPHSILPAAGVGPMGAQVATIALQKAGGPARSLTNIRRFFSIVMLLNGLHAIYLAFGVGFGAWAIAFATRGPAARSTLVLVAAYWIVVGGIGLILVPALYV